MCAMQACKSCSLLGRSSKIDRLILRREKSSLLARMYFKRLHGDDGVPFANVPRGFGHKTSITRHKCFFGFKMERWDMRGKERFGFRCDWLQRKSRIDRRIILESG